MSREPRSSPPARWIVAGGMVTGLALLATGMYAVGPAQLYRGDTWPDYLMMLVAAVVLLATFVQGAARDRTGAWSWRALRIRSLAAAAVFFLAFVAVTVPSADPQSPAPLDSLQGFATFVVMGSVPVVLAALVLAPRTPDLAQLVWDGARNATRTAGVERILLRRYRLISRRTFADVSRTDITLTIPLVFGRKRAWVVPLSEVGVVLPEEAARASYPQDAYPQDAPDLPDEWVTDHPFRVPYLATTTPYRSPNLTLLFIRPQPVPPIRWLAAADLDLSARASRRPGGEVVDGVQLRAVDAAGAVRVLLAQGALGIDDPDAFVQRHRPVVRDPAQVAARVTSQRWRVAGGVAVTLALAAAGFAFMATDDALYAVAVPIVLGASWLTRWAVAQRRPT